MVHVGGAGWGGEGVGGRERREWGMERGKPYSKTHQYVRTEVGRGGEGRGRGIVQDNNSTGAWENEQI